MAVKQVQVIVNGVTTTLTYNNETSKYEATITAPEESSYPLDGHYYPVTLKAEDDAGNITEVDDTDPTLGTSLRLVVKEETPPVISVASPTEGAYITTGTPTIEWTVTDTGSGVALEGCTLVIDSTTTVQHAEFQQETVSGGYKFTYTAAGLEDGEHSIVFNAQDNDGNTATETVDFTVDTVAPSLEITSPDNDIVINQSAITVSGTTSDITSSPVIVTIQVNEGEPVEAEVGEDGAFSEEVTLSNGANTITIVATDSAGKSTTVTRSVSLDTGAPVFQSVSIVPNPVDAGKTYIISVEVTD